MSTVASQVRGSQQPALLDETIGKCLRRISGEHGDREAVVSCSQNVRLERPADL
jgi:hypothetical protein